MASLAAFNLNILHRLNKELGADFDTGCFRHRARWNRVESRMEMHLESTCDQCVRYTERRSLFEFSFQLLKPSIRRTSYKFTQIRSATCSMTRALRSSRPGRTHGTGMLSRSLVAGESG